MKGRWSLKPARDPASEDRRRAKTSADGERRCLVSRVSGPRDRLIRFVVGPDDAIVPDVEERLPGRGLWLTAERGIVDRAVDQRVFGRAARQTVRVEDGLADRVEARLAARCIELLSLARRAGAAVAGATKVRLALEAGRPGVLVEARDGSPDTCRRLRALAGDRRVADGMTSVEIGRAFGRDHAVHAFVEATDRAGGLTVSLLRESGRLTGFRGPVGAPSLENKAGPCIQGAAR